MKYPKYFHYIKICFSVMHSSLYASVATEKYGIKSSSEVDVYSEILGINISDSTQQKSNAWTAKL